MVIDTILFARLPQWGSIDKKILHCSALRERPSPRVRRSAFDSPRSHFLKALSCVAIAGDREIVVEAATGDEIFENCIEKNFHVS